MDPVGQLIDDARKDARMKWTDLARAAEVDPQTLRRYRIGERRTDDTTRRIEIVFSWPRGYLDAIAAGDEPPATPAPAPDGGRDTQLAELREMVRILDEQAAEIRRRLDELDNAEDSAKRGA